MKTLRPLAGRMIVLPDKPEDRSSRGILFPDERRRKRHSGLCILHSPSEWWMETVPEGDLTLQLVYFERWSWKGFNAGTVELWVIPERAVFAIGEDDMTRDELIVELQSKVQAQVVDVISDNRDLSDKDVSDIDDALDVDARETVDEFEDAAGVEEDEEADTDGK